MASIQGNAAKIFPAVLILLQLGATVVYALKHDFRMTAYWFFAAGITAAVTF